MIPVYYSSRIINKIDFNLSDRIRIQIGKVDVMDIFKNIVRLKWSNILLVLKTNFLASGIWQIASEYTEMA